MDGHHNGTQYSRRRHRIAPHHQEQAFVFPYKLYWAPFGLIATKRERHGFDSTTRPTLTRTCIRYSVWRHTAVRVRQNFVSALFVSADQADACSRLNSRKQMASQGITIFDGAYRPNVIARAHRLATLERYNVPQVRAQRLRI